MEKSFVEKWRSNKIFNKDIQRKYFIEILIKLIFNF